MARTKGSLNKRTRVALNSLKTGELLGTGESPVGLMLRVMRDTEKPLELRLEAARSVAPYVHPRLNATEITSTVTTYVEHLRSVAALDTHAEPAPNQDQNIH